MGGVCVDIRRVGSKHSHVSGPHINAHSRWSLISQHLGHQVHSFDDLTIEIPPECLQRRDNLFMLRARCGLWLAARTDCVPGRGRPSKMQHAVWGHLVLLEHLCVGVAAETADSGDGTMDCIAVVVFLVVAPILLNGKQ